MTFQQTYGKAGTYWTHRTTGSVVRLIGPEIVDGCDFVEIRWRLSIGSISKDIPFADFLRDYCEECEGEL